jgi:hypothetical protein
MRPHSKREDESIRMMVAASGPMTHEHAFLSALQMPLATDTLLLASCLIKNTVACHSLRCLRSLALVDTLFIQHFLSSRHTL